MERAEREGWCFGAKLVRGAYMFMERDRARQCGYPSPIHDTIDATHANYNECVRRVHALSRRKRSPLQRWCRLAIERLVTPQKLCHSIAGVVRHAFRPPCLQTRLRTTQ